MLALFLLLYASSYIFFALTDPDALRSEKYKLQKMAIEQGLYGDSGIGLLEPATAGPLIEGPKATTETIND